MHHTVASLPANACPLLLPLLVGCCIVVGPAAHFLSSHAIVWPSMLLPRAAFAENYQPLPSDGFITSPCLLLLLPLLVDCCIVVCRPFLSLSCCHPLLTLSNCIAHCNNADNQLPLLPQFDCGLGISQLPWCLPTPPPLSITTTFECYQIHHHQTPPPPPPFNAVSIAHCHHCHHGCQCHCYQHCWTHYCSLPKKEATAAPSPAYQW